MEIICLFSLVHFAVGRFSSVLFCSVLFCSVLFNVSVPHLVTIRRPLPYTLCRTVQNFSSPSIELHPFSIYCCFCCCCCCCCYTVAHLYSFFFCCHWIQRETKKTKTDHFTSYFILVSQFGVQCLLLLLFSPVIVGQARLASFFLLVICNAAFSLSLSLLFGNGYHCWPAAFHHYHHHHQHFCCFQILFWVCLFSFHFAAAVQSEISHSVKEEEVLRKEKEGKNLKMGDQWLFSLFFQTHSPFIMFSTAWISCCVLCIVTLNVLEFLFLFEGKVCSALLFKLDFCLCSSSSKKKKCVSSLMNGRLFPLPPVVCQVVSGKKVEGKWSAKIAVNIDNRCSQWQVLLLMFFLVFSILLINDLWIFNFNGLLPSSQNIEKGQGKLLCEIVCLQAVPNY